MNSAQKRWAAFTSAPRQNPTPHDTKTELQHNPRLIKPPPIPTLKEERDTLKEKADPDVYFTGK